MEPASTAGFGGRVRIGSSATGQQSTVRVTTNTIGNVSVFGTSNASTNQAPVNFTTNGILEIRNDGSLAFGKNVLVTNSSTFYVGPGLGGSGVNGNASFAGYRVAQGVTQTVNSRNGFGLTFGTWAQDSSTGNNTLTNNAGGLVTFTG